MKVILMQDVAKLGRRFDIVEVPHGHALNMLIPRGMAQEASPQNVKNIESRALKAKEQRAAMDLSFVEALKSLKDKTVTVGVEANEKGHLFEALKPEKIISALSKEGVHITEKQVHIDVPIKEVGTHMVELKEGDVSSSVTIEVVAS